jgi:hypothetical protein
VIQSQRNGEAHKDSSGKVLTSLGTPGSKAPPEASVASAVNSDMLNVAAKSNVGTPCLGLLSDLSGNSTNEIHHHSVDFGQVDELEPMGRNAPDILPLTEPRGECPFDSTDIVSLAMGDP